VELAALVGKGNGKDFQAALKTADAHDGKREAEPVLNFVCEA
jgi:hypothetical protein